MYAVGRLGSYISQGVYTVSGPFHPFGGAVDIIVVEQQDGSFKSSPWYVRFGKFQGVLKSKKKVVTVLVDGVEANFHMYLDHKGEAYFLREVDDVEEEETLSSGEETDGLSRNDRMPLKMKSCNCDAVKPSPDHQIAVHNEKALTRAKSGQSRLRGLFGRKKSEESFHENEGGASVARVSSLERAEIAADLLELQWSTSLSTRKTKKGNASNLSSHDKLHVESDKDLQLQDEEGQPSFSAHDAMKNSSDNVILLEETGSDNKHIDSNSRSDSEYLNCSAEEATLGISCLRTGEKVVETLTVEKVLEEKCEITIISRVTCETCDVNADHDGDANGAFSGITGPNSRVICETSVGNADPDVNANGAISEIAGPKSQLQNSIKLEACSDQQFLVDQVPKEQGSILQGCVISQMDSSKNGVQYSSQCEMSDSSIVGLVDSSKQTNGTLCLANEGNVELPSEDTGAEQLAGDTRLEKELAEHSENHYHPTYSSGSWTPNHREEDLNKSLTITESCSQIVRVDPKIGSVEEVKSLSVCTTSSSTDSGPQVEGDKKVEDESINRILQCHSTSSGDLKELYGDNIPNKVNRAEPSQSSEDEQFLIGDLDEIKPNVVEQISPDQVGKENHPSFSLEGSGEVLDSVSASYESYSSLDKFVRDNPSIRTETSVVESRVTSSPISIPRSSKTADEEVVRLGESMPNMWFRVDNLDTHSKVCHPLSRSLDASPKSLKLTLLSKDDSNCSISDTERKHLENERPDMDDTQILGELNTSSSIPGVGMHSLGGEQIFEADSMIAEDRFDKPIEGDPSKLTSTTSGRWRLWPFSFRRSRSGKAKQPVYSDARSPDSMNATESTSSTDKTRNELRPKGIKKMFRANTPTSEQLASLKLREGRNTVTFTFYTGMLGDQQVDARIYLWKWNARIVISDVDGTITKSDVLGQFMPMVGMDWCQAGVAHLFSAIKENGYQLLFLSARAIAQAYHTRQFLLNIKQNGKALPDGPIVISPDGLFPSLFREVIRRAPHEFKIACLEDIRALFPSDCNPFYAGFGNRDTDEISYLRVGIPKGKIFTINPKGEVAVNRRVDTKSYTSLHDLVHDMFPSTSPEQEDFNSWNFWKLPPPQIDI